MVAVVLAAVASLNRGALTDAARLALTQKPEQSTALYFSDYRAIAKTVVVGSTYDVAFSITNHEARTVDYEYQALAASADGMRVLASGRTSLAGGATYNGQVSFTPTIPGRATQVVIELINTRQNISVRLNS
ncbi:hypothetical protein acdb102_19440 [Acidothermaceae bacterium B102]|nr:hypothetical protein acdb102_19440 [Acidothermaceae bacterium B102]